MPNLMVTPVMLDSIPWPTVTLGDVLKCVRVAMTGSTTSTGGIYEIMEILGKDETIKRLNDFTEYMQNNMPA